MQKVADLRVSRLSVFVSDGERDTLTRFGNIPIFQQHFHTKYYVFQPKTTIFYSFLHTIPETPDFCRKVYFCQNVSIATLTAVSKTHKKRGPPTTPVNPPLCPKSLDFKPFSYTFAKSFQIPMALFLNSRLCRC